jgi:hypothetical protein
MKLAGGQLMQPDELEALRCRKDKNAMVKSPKSRWCKGRCCKVDTIKVKGLPGGGLLFIGCLSLPFLTYFFQKKWCQQYGQPYTLSFTLVFRNIILLRFTK